MGDPEISVLIATACENPRLLGCLARVRQQVDAAGGELVVVFNRAPRVAQPDARRCERYADRVLFEPTPGKSRALNRGVDACRGDVIAFTDDDAEPAPGWLAALSAPLCGNARELRTVGCGGPVEPIFPPGTPRWFRRLVLSKPSNFLGPRHCLPEGTTEYRWAPGDSLMMPLGANCAYRREVFERYRYDPQLGPNRKTEIRGGEDTLLAVQLLCDGDRLLYVPEARVRHPVESERMDPAFVTRCFFSQGLESVKLRRLGFGKPLPSAAGLAHKIERAERRVRWLRWLGPAASRRARFELGYRLGLAAGAADDDAPRTGAPHPRPPPPRPRLVESAPKPEPTKRGPRRDRRRGTPRGQPAEPESFVDHAPRGDPPRSP